jgi:biopolymer transport protein ExbD
MKFHRKRKIESHIDMTPMLDTLLQVHIAFMFLMSFAASSAVKLNLPRAEAGEPQPERPVVVSIDEDNLMYLNDDLIHVEGLRGALAPLFEKSGKREVVLRADQGLSYQKVLKGLRAVAAAGATQVLLAYEEERSP